MLHLALAGNILCAIGGDPKLYKSQYVPRYPTKIFIEELNLNLEEPTEAQIRSFVQVSTISLLPNCLHLTVVISSNAPPKEKRMDFWTAITQLASSTRTLKQVSKT